MDATHDLCRHMDGGVQASTTDSLEYLFHYQALRDTSAMLKVADNTPHYPVGLDFLHVTADTDIGYVMVPTFYTPMLPATIISPSNLGSRLGCTSFTTFASLTETNCSITLHHCRRRTQDIRIPLMFVCGLLYTATLHCPSIQDHQSVLPSPSLHVHAVGHSHCCSPCSSTSSLPINSDLAYPLQHCVRLVQRMACQSDVDYASLHHHVDGLSPWPIADSCICDMSDSTLDPLVYHLNHLTHDQLCLLWHQHLGHLHSR